MDTHHHSSHAASAGGALDDADDGVSAAPAARAPAARLCAASAVQVVELEVTAGGRGASEERPAAAAGWQQQPRVAGAPAAIRTASRTRPDPGSGPTMSYKDGGADLPVRPQVSRPSLQSRFGIVHPQSERRRGNSKAGSQQCAPGRTLLANAPGFIQRLAVPHKGIGRAEGEPADRRGALEAGWALGRLVHRQSSPRERKRCGVSRRAVSPLCGVSSQFSCMWA